MTIGILGAADVAFRRFLPALQKCQNILYGGIASRGLEKAAKFQKAYGGRIYPSYDTLLEDPEIDAVYLPLPPALHFLWGERAINAGKHILMEKPFATSLDQTKRLLVLAKEKGLAAYENYMFLCHSQLKKIKALVAEEALGELRLIRISFGFPKREKTDFRYQKALGGGALLDCGGYPVRLASGFLGESLQVAQAELCRPDTWEVDLFGSAVLKNRAGLCAQISFGMDNAYQCQLELWGSKATLIAPRIFTAGPDISPKLILRSSFDEQVLELPCDDHFLHSIESFAACVVDGELRSQNYAEILKQAEIIEKIRLSH